MRVLVTGAGGFIGSHLVRRLREDNEVVSLVHEVPLHGVWIREALDGTTIVRGDIRDMNFLREVISRYRVGKVYHLAALASVKTAHKDPYGVYNVNVMGTVSLLEACRQVGVEKILLLETDKVYGEGTAAEYDSLRHSEPYATSKCCQELIARSYMDTYDMNIVIPHSCNVFGFDPHSDRIFPNTIKRCLKGEPPLIYTNDASLREYIYVEDVVDVLVELMDGNYLGCYNIPTGWIYTQAEVVEEILKFFPGLRAEYVEARLPRQIRGQKLVSFRWDWKPRWTWEEAIGATIEAFRKYEEDWR
jgi:UDP-glucose 4-epimerase